MTRKESFKYFKTRPMDKGNTCFEESFWKYQQRKTKNPSFEEWKIYNVNLQYLFQELICPEAI